ncbi:MAG: hypothetical protein LBU50_04895, partial [Cellulomonas sp.]|nr:hypothetical protein [Cellulomonas sp.]
MLSPTRRPKVLVLVASVVLVACCLPLVRVVVGEDGHWLWLVLLSTRRAATTSVAASALAALVIGVVWWLDERRHAERARAGTAWLADVGPSTSTWAPRWVTLGGLGFVALGFMLVFSSGGEDGKVPWDAPEAVAPVVSLVKLVGGLLLLAAPGTLLGGASWWVSRHQVRSDLTATRPDGPARGTGHDGAAPTGPASPDQGGTDRSGADRSGTDRSGTDPSDQSGTDQSSADGSTDQSGAVPTTSLRGLLLTGPRRPTWLVAVGATLALAGAVVAVAANVAVGVQSFPGVRDVAPPGGLLRCCTFVATGTALTTWAVVACFLLWTGLTVVAVGAYWWDSERQAGRPDAPAWMDGLVPDPSPVVGVFPPTGAPPEPDRAESAEQGQTTEPTAGQTAEPTTGQTTGPTVDPTAEPAPRDPTFTARRLVVVGVVTSLVGAMLTVSLRTDRVGTVLYLYDVGPAVLGLVFLLPVGLALVASGGLWWFLVGTR